jgi:N-acetylmuramoyl-L-alanine amidase
MKKLAILLFSLFVLFIFVHAYASKKAVVPSQVADVVVNGKVLNSIHVYKMSGQIKYFSVKEIAKIYDATLAWKPVSFQVTMNLNKKKITIKANNTLVIFGKKLRRMSLPSRLIEDDIYIPSEIIVSPEFAEITKTDTRWDSSALMLNIEHHPNLIVEYFTGSESTRVLVHLNESLPYTVSKTSNTIILKILRGKIQNSSINVSNGTIENIEYGICGQSAVIKINLSLSPEFIKTSKFIKPDRIVIDIMHSQNTNVTDSIKVKTLEDDEKCIVRNDSSQEFDLTAHEKCITAQTKEIVSVIENENDKNNKDFVPISLEKFENNNTIDDNAVIIDNSTMCLDVIPPKNVDNKNHYKRKKIIVLDAGHGGDDPGAVGPNGIKEKDINLEIVRELKSLFDNNEDYDIILTRSDDTFIPLAERTGMANRYGADLFISVHCNASFDKNVNGFEIYFLSEKATDPAAAATALLENSVLELEDKPNKKCSLLRNVLWSMCVNEYMNESSELSGFILTGVTKRLKVSNRGVKQANFYVLRGAKMPAVLVESAFLSNYAEEAKLSSKKFRIAIAYSIYDGVTKYYATKQARE